MLSLRKNLVFGKKRRGSASSSIASDGENRPSSSSTMAAVQPGLSDGSPVIKHSRGPSDVNVRELLSDSDSEGHTAVESQILEGDSSALQVTNRTSRIEHFSRPVEVTRYVKDVISRFPDYRETFVTQMDLRSYLQYISDERLTHMPRRGSGWDRVLSTAQFFGLQVWFFGSKIEEFAPGCATSARAALASCQVLLGIGHDQADALAPTFTALYELSMLLSNISQVRDLKYMPIGVLKGAADIFLDIVYLVSNISAYYKQKIGSLRPGRTVTISFDAHFGSQIDNIWDANNTLCDNIWRYKLSSKASINDLRRLRLKLQPTLNASVRNTLYDEVLEHLERSEDTCVWIKDALVNFFDGSEQSLTVTGPAGLGKTVLAEWVQERLARPLDYRSYSVLQYNFPFDSMKDASAIAFLKSILFQLLEQNVGEYQMYGYIAEAFAQDKRNRHDPKKLEDSLWEVLHHCLKLAERGDSTIVILTDGCDDSTGSAEKVVAFHKQLRKYTSKLVNTRIINFARILSPSSDKTKQLTVSEQDVYEDIKTHFRQTLARSRHWSQLTAAVQEDIIVSLAKKANGSFLWAFETSRLLVPKDLKKELSHDAFINLAKSIPSDIPRVLSQVVDRLDLKNRKTLQLLLSFMLITTEPFSVPEVAELLSVGQETLRIDTSIRGITRLVSQECSDLVVIRDGRLHFRSASVRNFMQTMLGKQLLAVSEAHLQLSIRMLQYVKLSLDSDQELTTDVLDDSAVDTILGHNQFLGYVLRNWLVHFKLSGQIGAKGELKLSKGFTDVFPDSVLFVLLERSYWGRYHFGQEMADLSELALKIRQSCFGEKHITVLQTLINLAHVHISIYDSPVRGAGYFYLAVKLGQSILSNTHTVVASCVSLFLNCTKNITITERTDIVTYREEMIRLMITICKHKYGDYSDEVIAWYETLALLYVDIKEEWRATVVYRELREIIIRRYGAKSRKADQIGRFLGDVDIVLKGSESDDHIHQIEELIFETSENMEITDHICIKLLIKLAKSYMVARKFYLAERLFLSLWRRICIIGRVNANTDVHISKITIALEYVKFLREVKRIEEATSILICLWTEYEHYECKHDALIILIRKIGTVCRSFGMLSITISIFTKVWAWFKIKGRAEHEEAQKTTVLITEVVEEWTEVTVTEKTTSVNTIESVEVIVKEIYEMHYDRCKKLGVDKRFFSAGMALIGLYIKNLSWGEAEAVIKRTLDLSWKALLSTDVKITLTEHWIKESVAVARRLGYCYHQQSLFEMAEKIYLRIYYACLTSCQMEDELLQESIVILIKFYEEHHRHSRVIEIYVEVLERYRKHLGNRHQLTIKNLYLLAAACELIGHKDTYQYYLEIVTILNKSHKHCHRDASKACLWLFRHYYTHKKWSEFRDICYVLWETICNHDQECEFTDDVVIEIYKKFTSVLELHFKVDFKVLYELAVKYKDVVIGIFGIESAAYILALIALAELCEKHEEHYHESITVYEEVLKRITTTKTGWTTTVTETTIHTVKRRLAKMYVTVITTGKGGAKKTYPVDRALEICIETYEQLKIELGCWHQTTLAALKDIVVMYQKLNGKESHARIIQLLQVAVAEVITTVTITADLFNAAVTLGSIHLSAGFAREGHELLRQLRHLIVFKGTMPGHDITLQLSHFPSKIVFVFLTAFEQGLGGHSKTFSYTEIMVNIIFESVLYEEYARVVEYEQNLEIILECAAKLRGFWEEHKRTNLLVTLDTRLFALFKKKYGSLFNGANDNHIHIFYLAVMLELNRDRSTKMDFSALCCKAGNDRVRRLLDEADFHGAQQVAQCAFQFASGQKLYYERSCIQYGYKLAELMAGIDVPHPTNNKQADIRNAMLDTSREIMNEVLAAFRSKDIKIDMLELRFNDLTGLIRLLGAQNNFGELENLLVRLWNARETMQRSRGWSPEVVLSVGKMLVDAQVAHGHMKEAIDTAELLYYNLRRGRGRLDLETLAFSRLLASLYTHVGRHANAMATHEAVLREIGSAYHRHGSGENLPDRSRLITEAKLHLDLMRASYHQMKGWNKPIPEVSELYTRLKSSLKLEVPNFEQWVSSKADKNAPDGKYIAPQEWVLKGEVKDSVSWKRETKPTDNMDVIQAARGWWLIRW